MEQILSSSVVQNQPRISFFVENSLQLSNTKATSAHYPTYTGIISGTKRNLVPVFTFKNQIRCLRGRNTFPITLLQEFSATWQNVMSPSRKNEFDYSLVFNWPISIVSIAFIQFVHIPGKILILQPKMISNFFIPCKVQYPFYLKNQISIRSVANSLTDGLSFSFQCLNWILILQ